MRAISASLTIAASVYYLRSQQKTFKLPNLESVHALVTVVAHENFNFLG